MKKVIIGMGILSFLIGSILVIHNFYSTQKTKEEDRQELENFFETFSDTEEEPVLEEPKEETKQVVKTNYVGVLEIPKINLKTGIVWSNKSFSTMNRNVSIYPTSVLPDKVGNLILFGHSGTTSVGYFHKLNQLQNNDFIYLYYNQKTYTYKVFEIWEVSAANNTPLKQTDKNTITLLTCKRGNNKRRLVIRGELIDNV